MINDILYEQFAIPYFDLLVYSPDSRPYKNSKSKIRNVNWNSNKQCWHAKVNINKKRIHLGSFKNMEDAEQAVKDYKNNNDIS